MDRTDFSNQFRKNMIRWDRRFFVCCLAHRGSTGESHLLQLASAVVLLPRDLQLPCNTLYLSSFRL